MKKEDDLTFAVLAPRGERGAKRSRGAKTPGNPGGQRKGRQFDRQSQTGRTDSNKQKAAWGGEDGQKELATEEAAKKDAEAAETAPGTPAEPKEPEETTKTLDEYLAERASKKLDIGAPEVRKANEGTEGVSGVQLLRDSQEEHYFVAPKAQPKEPKAKSQKSSKVTIEIDGQFAKPESERRPRNTNGRGPSRGRGRGGAAGRGRSGRQGGPQRKENAGANVNLNDEKAFPTLA